MQYLKWTEVKDENAGIRPSLPMDANLLNTISQSKLYKVIRLLPKGGNLHSHERK